MIWRLFFCLLLMGGAVAQDQEAGERLFAGAVKDDGGRIGVVEELTREVLDSVVTITTEGRRGRGGGEGSGFVVSDDGLIATNLHVIGQARPVQVKFRDGTVVAVEEVYASDADLDLAVLRIDRDGLKALEIGDSDEVSQGEDVVALGNPRGLDFSVVRGVVSAVREIDGNEMLQMAIPVEQGNSGGPVVDMEGRVQGILTMKSTVTQNLGFAMPANALRLLLDQPNPVSMEDWVHIGALDPAQWTPLMGAAWSGSAGRVRVDGFGSGFGGRSLCLSEIEVPELPYEIAVEVRLDDESGAAGLAFCSDGGDVHYGFYPTAGSLRLTCFEGPVVYTWTILDTVPVDSYKEGEWNRLRVRIEENGVKCYVNDQLAIESDDAEFREGKVGLCKFRNTLASFREFEVGEDLAPKPVPKDLARLFDAEVEILVRDEDGAFSEEGVRKKLEKRPELAKRLFEDRAQQLEQVATELRRVAEEVHLGSVADAFRFELEKDESDLDLGKAALLIAWARNPDLDIEVYEIQLSKMAEVIRSKLEGAKSDEARVELLIEELCQVRGYRGSRFDYYNPANSFLNEVIDDREGIPITLSVLFIELAGRLGMDSVHGVPLPGHFVVGYEGADGTKMLADIFHGKAVLAPGEAEKLVFERSGIYLQEEHLQPASKREILLRMLSNLVGVHFEDEDPAAALAYLDLYLQTDPEAVAQRMSRGFLRYRNGESQKALIDFRKLEGSTLPQGFDGDRLRGLIQELELREEKAS